MINIFSNGKTSHDEHRNPVHLKSIVVFNCEIPVLGGYAVRKESFKTIDELKALVKEFHKLETPSKITVIRSVKVVGKNNKHNVYSTVANEKIILFVCDKLMYPADARQILLKKYGTVFDFDTQGYEENTPLRSLSVIEHRSIGLRTTRGPSETHWRSVYFEQAGPDHIIVNPNLQQMWPENTGHTPDILTEMLLRKKEIIH